MRGTGLRRFSKSVSDSESLCAFLQALCPCALCCRWFCSVRVSLTPPGRGVRDQIITTIRIYEPSYYYEDPRQTYRGHDL